MPGAIGNMYDSPAILPNSPSPLPSPVLPEAVLDIPPLPPQTFPNMLRPSAGLLERSEFPELSRPYTSTEALSEEEAARRTTAFQYLKQWADDPDVNTLAFPAEYKVLQDHDIPQGVHVHRPMDLDGTSASLPIVEAFQSLLVRFRPGNPPRLPEQEYIPSSAKVCLGWMVWRAWNFVHWSCLCVCGAAAEGRWRCV